MALIECPECGKEISENATACPNCGNPMGHPISEPKSKDQPKVEVKGKGEGCFLQTLNVGCIIFFIIIGLIVLLIIFAGLSS